MTSSKALVGRLKLLAVLALPIAMSMEALCVLSIVTSITRFPLVSTIATAMGHCLPTAKASAAATNFFAFSRVMDSPYIGIAGAVVGWFCAATENVTKVKMRSRVAFI